MRTQGRDRMMETFPVIPMDDPLSSKIETAFTYHAPKPGQPEIYTRIRGKAKELAYLIDELVPASREQRLAFTKLEEVVMWANAGVARNG